MLLVNVVVSKCLEAKRGGCGEIGCGQKTGVINAEDGGQGATIGSNLGRARTDSEGQICEGKPSR